MTIAFLYPGYFQSNKYANAVIFIIMLKLQAFRDIRPSWSFTHLIA